MTDLAELYRRHSRAAMAAEWMAVGDADRASEIVQDTFVRCAARRSAIRDERLNAGWMSRTTSRSGSRRARQWVGCRHDSARCWSEWNWLDRAVRVRRRRRGSAFAVSGLAVVASVVFGVLAVVLPSLADLLCA